MIVNSIKTSTLLAAALFGASVASPYLSESGLGESFGAALSEVREYNADPQTSQQANGGRLRNFGFNNKRQLLDLDQCYGCNTDKGPNPCEVRTDDDPFYFRHCTRPNMFVQCSEQFFQCWDRKCATGTLWYQFAQTCCHYWDIVCQNTPPDNRNGDSVDGKLDSTCSGYGETCGTKPCYNHQEDIWPPELASPSWCESNKECESCCCGEWAGTYRVCTDSVDYGKALENVCMNK